MHGTKGNQLKLVPLVTESGEFDLLIRSFGAADPDPITWLTLVFESDYRFVDDFKGEIRKKFAQIKSIKDSRAQ